MLGAIAYGLFAGGCSVVVMEEGGFSCGSIGVRKGLVRVVAGVACLVGPPLGGLVLERTGGWKGLAGLSGASLMLGGGLVVFGSWLSGGDKIRV